MTPTDVAAVLRAHSHEGPIPYLMVAQGWRFGFSHTPGACGLHIFSAQLVPEGRGSCDADWAFLGAMAAALQLPPSAAQQLVEQAEHSDPNGVMKAVWFEAV